jgi:hypothetical protein
MIELKSKHIHFSYFDGVFSFVVKGKKVVSGAPFVCDSHDCGALHINVSPAPNSMAVITLLPKTKEVRLDEVPESIATSLPNLISADDWLIVTKLIKNFRNPDISPFSDNEIKNNLPMMTETSVLSFAKLCPFSEFVSKENMENLEKNWTHGPFVLTDSYCITPSCHCNNAGLLCQTLPEQEHDKSAAISFFVDLITHKISSVEKSENWNNAISPEHIVEVFKESEPRFIQNLVERRARIRKKVLDVFGPSFLADDPNSEEPLKPFVRTSAKIGRNEKCPCGSNKKYKHCCGI